MGEDKDPENPENERVVNTPDSDAEQESSESNPLRNTVAVLICLSTIVGALIAWRAALSEDIAGDADYAGLRSLAWAEEAKTLNTMEAYEDYRLFLAYKGHDKLGDLIEENSHEADEEESSALGRDLEESRQISEINIAFLDETKASRYLNRDGTFGLERELGEKWAADTRKYDMNSEPRFQEADRYRDKTEKQLKAGILVTIALVLFTLFEAFSGPVRKVSLALGVLLFLGSTVWALMLEGAPV